MVLSFLHPSNASSLIFAIPKVKSVFGYATDGNLTAMMEHMNLLSLIGVVVMLFFVWSIFWEYKAFAESTNVKNGKGVGCFIAVYILAYVVSALLVRFI